MVSLVPSFIPKVALAAGVVCLSTLAGWGFSKPHDLETASASRIWITFAIGFALTGVGLTATAQRLSRKHGAGLGISLLSFGAVLFVLALGIAHVGLPLLFVAVPAIVWGAAVCLIAAFQH
jgi:fucose permease